MWLNQVCYRMYFLHFKVIQMMYVPNHKRLRTSSFRAGFKRSLLSAERKWVAFAIKEMASMAVLTTFLWSNEDSDSFWHFKVSFAICKIAEVAKLIDFWMSDNLLSTLLWYGRIFQFWPTASLSFGTLTNSQLFGMSSLSAIFLTTRNFRDSSSQYRFATSANWPDVAGPVFYCDRIVTIYLTENVRSFFIYTLVLNIWASFPDLGRNTLVFCYCCWVMIDKVTFTVIINIRLRCSKRYGGFRALTMNVMNVMSSMGWPWSVRAFVLFPNWWSPCRVPTFIPYLFPWSSLSFNKPI